MEIETKKCRAICRHSLPGDNYWKGEIRADYYLAEIDLADHQKTCEHTDGSIIYEGDINW